MKCSARDCPHEAKWRPRLLLRPRVDYDGPAATLLVGIGVCDEEHKSGNPELFITDEFWKAILASFDQHGRARPHRSFTRVEYVDLDAPEAQAFDNDFADQPPRTRARPSE